MNGYVTWIFSILLFIVGMAMMMLSIKFPLQQAVLIGMGIQCIGVGGGLIGIGRKVEKQTKVIQASGKGNASQ